MLQDLRFALRIFRRKPGFTLAVVLALGLGIGATSAMFSVVNGVLLRPLPFPRSDRLVNIWETNLKRNFPKFVVAPANYYDWRKQNQVFSSIGAYQPNIFNLENGVGEPERYMGVICDRAFFDTLGVAPLMGRVFTEQEEAPGNDGVVVLSYGIWQQRFGGDPNVLQQSIQSNGRTRKIIGVMPPSFTFPPQANAMYSPPNMDPAAKARRDLHRLRVIGRLKDSVDLERAQSSFSTLGTQLAAEYPFFNQDTGIVVIPMLEDVVGDLRSALRILLGAVAFVLLIACANAANLLLAKAAGRRREIAIRTSMGASRARVFRQVLTESLLLSLAGGVAGLLFAKFAFRGLLSLAPSDLPRLNEVSLDAGALFFTLGVSILTGILFGLAPAWHASRIDMHSMLKEGSRGAGSRNRVRSLLVVVQVAAALVLLAGAGLLIRSFYEVAHIDAGFDPQHLMTMRFAPAPFKFNNHPEMQIQLARNMLTAVAALPGVKSAAIASDLPLAGGSAYIMRFEGRPDVTPAQAPVTNYVAVTPEYVSAMGMHLLRGRFISDHDTAGTTPVMVINQTLATRFFPNQDPIGKRMEIGFSTPPNWREIIGVVADVHANGLDQDTPVQSYAAFYQQPVFVGLRPLAVLARTVSDPGPLAVPMKAALLNVDRSQPIYAMQPMTEIVAESIAERRFSLVLLAFFASAALFLAALGLYGVMSFVAQQRTPEIGLRMALGAQPMQVLMLVERQGMALVLMGVAIGAIGGIFLTGLMASLLFHVKPGDPGTLIACTGVLLAVGLLACYIPARRAAKVDPLVALRYE
jgi:predicted permease